MMAKHLTPGGGLDDYADINAFEMDLPEGEPWTTDAAKAPA